MIAGSVRGSDVRTHPIKPGETYDPQDDFVVATVASIGDAAVIQRKRITVNLPTLTYSRTPGTQSRAAIVAN
jgi:phosphoribosylpyrophosphate synthetase